MIAALLLFSLHIASGSAAERLMQLAQDTDVSILYDYEELDLVQTHALDGQYTLSGALCVMLGGTLAAHEFTSPRTVTVILGEEEACPRPSDWGPPWIHPPQADWK